VFMSHWGHQVTSQINYLFYFVHNIYLICFHFSIRKMLRQYETNYKFKKASRNFMVMIQ
jgi:hypothetical protein